MTAKITREGVTKTLEVKPCKNEDGTIDKTCFISRGDVSGFYIHPAETVELVNA